MDSERENGWFASRRQYEGEQRTVSYQETILPGSGFEGHD
jgi:hypothetical protein